MRKTKLKLTTIRPLTIDQLRASGGLKTYSAGCETIGCDPTFGTIACPSLKCESVWCPSVMGCVK